MRVNSAEELEVCEEVGRGAFGVVYRGLVRATNEEVAIKQIDLENEHADLIEVNKEIQIISECRIPQITQFKGCFVKEYKLWVIMEYVNGGSLFDLLRPGPVTNELVISTIVKEILVALLYLHNQGKIHRDLKSQNILLNRNGEVKLTDFGVSTQLSSNFSRRNTTVGTPYWMAPEVILNNKGGHSFKADIWSLGCCCYELFTGKPPLQNLYSPMKALRQISRCHDDQDFVKLIGLEDLEESRGMSACLKDFLYQCFLVDPKERASATRLLKHRFITDYDGKSKEYKSKELKKLITKKQLWDQEHHVSKVQNFYVPTEIKRNQEKWNGNANQLNQHHQNDQSAYPKTIHFDMSSIVYEEGDADLGGHTDGGILGSDFRDITPPSEGTGNTTPGDSGTPNKSSKSSPQPSNEESSVSPPPPASVPSQLQYRSFTRPDPKQENLKRTLQPELSKIVNKVFYKLESKNSLLTSQYDSLVALNDSILSLVSFISYSQSEKSPKVLICQYLRYLIKELMRDGPNEGRKMLQRLIVPSVLESRATSTVNTRYTTLDETVRRQAPQTQFDEIEQSLLESWIEKMKE